MTSGFTSSLYQLRQEVTIRRTANNSSNDLGQQYWTCRLLICKLVYQIGVGPLRQ